LQQNYKKLGNAQLSGETRDTYFISETYPDTKDLTRDQNSCVKHCTFS